MTPDLVRIYKPATAALAVVLAIVCPLKNGSDAAFAAHHQSMGGSFSQGPGQAPVRGHGYAHGQGAGRGQAVAPALLNSTSQTGTERENQADAQAEVQEQDPTVPINGLTPNGFPLSNQKAADHIEDEINRQRALDVSYRHAIARQLVNNWHPEVGGYVAYLLGLSKTGKVERIELSAASGDAAAASKAIKATHFPPLPRGIAAITYSIDFKGTRAVSIAQYAFTKDADEEKVPVNLNDATLEVTERKPKPAASPKVGAVAEAPTTTRAFNSNNAGTDGSGNLKAATDASAPEAASTSTSTSTSKSASQDGTGQMQADMQDASAPPPDVSPQAAIQVGTQKAPATESATESAKVSATVSGKIAPPQLGSAQPVAPPAPPPSAKQLGQPAPADLLQYQKTIEAQICKHIASAQELTVWDNAITFKIAPDGKIREQKILRTSGSQRIDAAVKHAIDFAAPTVNFTDTQNAQFQANVVFNGIIDGKVVPDARPTCTVQLIDW